MGICSFASAIGDMPKKDQKHDDLVLRVLEKNPRFSAFDASDNMGIAKTLTRLMQHGYMEYPEPQPGYPWCVVKITAKGYAMLIARRKA